MANFESVIYHAKVNAVEVAGIDSAFAHFEFTLKWDGQIVQTRSVPSSVIVFASKTLSFDILLYDVTSGTHQLRIEGLHPFLVVDQRFKKRGQACVAGCAECPSQPAICTKCLEGHVLWDHSCLIPIRFEFSLTNMKLRILSTQPVTFALLSDLLFIDYPASGANYQFRVPRPTFRWKPATRD